MLGIKKNSGYFVLCLFNSCVSSFVKSLLVLPIYLSGSQYTINSCECILLYKRNNPCFLIFVINITFYSKYLFFSYFGNVVWGYDFLNIYVLWPAFIVLSNFFLSLLNFVNLSFSSGFANYSQICSLSISCLYILFVLTSLFAHNIGANTIRRLYCQKRGRIVWQES